MDFDANKVTSVYMGRDNACRCGCKGKYVARGDAQFDQKVKRFARMWAEYVPNEMDVDVNFMNVSYGKDRAITVYFD